MAIHVSEAAVDSGFRNFVRGGSRRLNTCRGRRRPSRLSRGSDPSRKLLLCFGLVTTLPSDWHIAPCRWALWPSGGVLPVHSCTVTIAKTTGGFGTHRALAGNGHVFGRRRLPETGLGTPIFMGPPRRRSFVRAYTFVVPDQSGLRPFRRTPARESRVPGREYGRCSPRCFVAFRDGAAKAAVRAGAGRSPGAEHLPLDGDESDAGILGYAGTTSRSHWNSRRCFRQRRVPSRVTGRRPARH